ncbi:MAG TPA: GNAT family N-acetyltransferase [Candidatus Limnocylindrales bacterium]
MDAEVRPLRCEDEDAVRRVMRAALQVDAYPGFDAQELERELQSMLGAPEDAIVTAEGGSVCGYLYDTDLTVHPECRRRGHGRRLFAAGMERAAGAGLNEISLYVPFSGAGRSFAVAMGLAHKSSLWRLDLAPGAVVEEPSFPHEIAGRTFGSWVSLERFVDLLNVSFADHPSPIAWTVAQIEFAHSRPGFDPTGIFLLTPADSPHQLIGFARISLDPPEDGELAPVGDIRLVGVLPPWRGRGLGRELLRWGVADLRRRGAGRIQLSVEAENGLALGLYRRTGFEPSVEWPHWTRRTRR